MTMNNETKTHIDDVATHIAVSKGISSIIHFGYPGGFLDWKSTFLINLELSMSYNNSYKETISVCIPWCCEVNQLGPVCSDEEMCPAKGGFSLIQVCHKPIPGSLHLWSIKSIHNFWIIWMFLNIPTSVTLNLKSRISPIIPIIFICWQGQNKAQTWTAPDKAPNFSCFLVSPQTLYIFLLYLS